jgi:hypothetical protein
MTEERQCQKHRQRSRDRKPCHDVCEAFGGRIKLIYNGWGDARKASLVWC